MNGTGGIRLLFIRLKLPLSFRDWFPGRSAGFGFAVVHFPFLRVTGRWEYVPCRSDIPLVLSDGHGTY